MLDYERYENRGLLNDAAQIGLFAQMPPAALFTRRALLGPRPSRSPYKSRRRPSFQTHTAEEQIAEAMHRTSDGVE